MGCAAVDHHFGPAPSRVVARRRISTLGALLITLVVVASACGSAAEIAAPADVAVAVDGSEVSLAPGETPRLLWFWGPF